LASPFFSAARLFTATTTLIAASFATRSSTARTTLPATASWATTRSATPTTTRSASLATSTAALLFTILVANGEFFASQLSVAVGIGVLPTWIGPIAPTNLLVVQDAVLIAVVAPHGEVDSLDDSSVIAAFDWTSRRYAG